MSTTISFIQQYPFILAFLFGLLPALTWLWFWLKEDVHPESHKMITLSFMGGMLAVIFVLPSQKIIYNIIHENNRLAFILWAICEEFFKFIIVYFIALRNKKVNDEPVDDIIYLIISALGFVALENTLFVMDLIKMGDFTGAILNANMRFIGAGLLHVLSSATIGTFLAFSYYKSFGKKLLSAILGFAIAVTLHTEFNLFIIKESSDNVLFIFGAVWIGIVAILLFFEKVKKLKSKNI